VDDLYKAFIGAPSISATNLINLYGIKYVISLTPITKDPSFQLIYARLEGLRGKKEDLLKENTIKLYRKKDVFPRAWLVEDYRVMESDDILLKLKSKDFQPERKVLLEEKPLPINPKSEIPAHPVGRRNPKSLRRLPSKVEIVSESNNKIQLHVSTAENSFLVLSDTYFPGWKAYVDGREAKIFCADFNFRAVSMHPGSHHVEFVYFPLSLKIGALITLLGVMGCLALWLTKRVRAHGRTPGEEGH
jgi:hypothetical protein